MRCQNQAASRADHARCYLSQLPFVALLPRFLGQRASRATKYRARTGRFFFQSSNFHLPFHERCNALMRAYYLSK